MRCLIFDLETVPCLAIAARLWGLDPEHPDAFRHAEDRRFSEGEKPSTFMKPFMHRIVGLGMVLMDTMTGEVGLKAPAGEDEPGMLRAFHSWLAGGPVLVGWNTLSFDLPVLRYRALFHGQGLPRLYGPAGQKSCDKYDYRFGDNHYDLCDVLSGYGRSTSLKLSEAASLCGVPCKTQGTGAGVLDLWKAADYQQISEYVGEDARVTARIFLRWQLTRGRLERSVMESLDAKLAICETGLVPAGEPVLELGVA